ncbi:MAG: hypothetical protein HY319_14665 [Armatimonadetes bacterium]|nr:hypothetical protein [Armatimonadota bacterium]
MDDLRELPRLGIPEVGSCCSNWRAGTEEWHKKDADERRRGRRRPRKQEEDEPAEDAVELSDDHPSDEPPHVPTAGLVQAALAVSQFSRLFHGGAWRPSRAKLLLWARTIPECRLLELDRPASNPARLVEL